MADHNSILHEFVSAVPDDLAHPEWVRPSNWNHEHILSGGINGQKIIFDDTQSDNINFRDDYFVNVKDFGAVGNGSVDDTVAIQAALDSVSSVYGGVVYFPPGRYGLSGPGIRVKKNYTKLWGAGQQSSVFTVLTYWNSPPFAGSVAAMLSLIHGDVGAGGTPVTHLIGTEIRSLGFLNNTAHGTDANSPKTISSLYADNVVIEGCDFRDACHECIWPAGSPLGDEWRILNNNFYNCGNGSLFIDGSAVQCNFVNGIVALNQFNACHGSISAGVALARTLILGNRILNPVVRGIGVAGDAPAPDGITVVGNYVLITADPSTANPTRYGILVVDGATHASITDNTVVVKSITGGNTVFGIYIAGASDQVKISGNNVRLECAGGNLAAGRSMQGIGGQPGGNNLLNVMVSDNYVKITGSTGFVGFGGIVLLLTDPAHTGVFTILNNYIEGFSEGNSEYALRLVDTTALATLTLKAVQNICTSGLQQYSPLSPVTDGSLNNIPVTFTTPGQVRQLSTSLSTRGLSSGAVSAKNLAGTVSFSSGDTSKAVTFANVEADTSYRIVLSADSNKSFWWSTKATTGFTINKSSSGEASVVDWFIAR